MSAAPSFAGLNLGGTYGALLLGTFFSLVLYGLILHQMYRYIRLHPHDYTYIQVLVALSLVMETLQTICTMHFIYHALVTNYFNPLALSKTVWSLDFFVLTGTFSQIATYSYLTHLRFFLRRLYFISGNFKYIAVLAVVFLAIDTGFSIAMTIQVFQLKDVENFLSIMMRQRYLVHGKFSAAIATHILLTGSLIYALYRGQKARKEQKSMVDWCFIYVVNTGLLVSVFDLIAWILAYTIPETIWWAALGPITVKLYMVTFLSVLNSRRLLTETFIEIFGSDSASSSQRNFISRTQRLATAERYNAPQLPDCTPTRIDIKVATEVEEGDCDAQSRTSHSSMMAEGGKAAGL